MFLSETEAATRVGYDPRTLRRKVKAKELRVRYKTNPAGKCYQYWEAHITLIEKQFTSKP